MAPNTPPDDDRDAEVDPWADIVADGLTDDGDQGAFDFAGLDVRAVEPAGEPVAALPPDDLLDPVADDAVADLDGVFPAAAAATPGDSTALADDVFAALVGGDEPDDLTSGDRRGTAEGTDDGADDDAFADMAADGVSAPALSVFAPDDVAGWDASSTDSDAFAAGVLDDMAPGEAAGAAVTAGAGPADHEPDAEAFGWAAPDTTEAGADGAAWGDVVSATTDDDESETGIPVFATDGAELAVGAAVGAAAGAAVASGAESARRAPRRPARGKSGAGQFLGIVLGGALSIPIVLGILIGTMWMGRPDPIGMRRWLPGASFLLPPARQPRGGGEQPRDLDSLSPVAGSTAGDRVDQVTESPESAPPPGDINAPVAAVAAVAPAVAPAADVPAASVPTAASSEVTDPAASPPPADRLAAVPAPAVADLDALAAVPPLPPEPEPLDLATLDAAVEQAAAAAGVLHGADADDPDRRRHMVAWYRSLSRVAEELAAVEALAVESGRPFEEAVVRLDPLMTTLAPDGPLGGDLVRLARNWLTYARRDSDGVVLPVTFQSARPVGPYWCSKVVIEDVGGEPRELAVVSRQRPFLEIGERCVVTGVLFDGGTVWAADVRSTDAPPAVPDAPAQAEQSATNPPDLPPAAADAPPVPGPPATDAAPRKAPAAVPEIEVPEIPVPDLDVPGPPVPPPQSVTEPPANDDAPAADDF